MAQKKYRFLLLSPDHPEILAFAKHLIDLGIPFILGSQFVIQEKFVNILRLILPKSGNLFGWISKRKFPNVPRNSRLILLSTVFEITARILLKFRFPRLAKKLFGMQQNLFALRSQRFINKLNYQYLVINEDFQGNIPPDKKVITISFHGDPIYVREKEILAWERYPSWKPDQITPPRKFSAVGRADVIVCLSEFAANGVRKNIPKVKKVVSIPIGPVHTNLGSDNFNASTSRLLYVGRLIAAKGVPTLLEVAKHMHESFYLNLCGSFNSIANRELKHFQYENIRCNYDLSNYRLMEMYRKSDIFIFPTYYEGFGISLLEAMSFGLIPVSSTNCIASEIFSGTPLERFLFEPGDYESILNSLDLIRNLSANEVISLKRTAKELSLRYSFVNFATNLLKTIENPND